MKLSPRPDFNTEIRSLVGAAQHESTIEAVKRVIAQRDHLKAQNKINHDTYLSKLARLSPRQNEKRSMNTKLGKIAGCHLGYGGYQDTTLGMVFALTGDGWGTDAFWPVDDKFRDRLEHLLHRAKVYRIDRLIGVPIEATFEASTLKDWRILTEVL